MYSTKCKEHKVFSYLNIHPTGNSTFHLETQNEGNFTFIIKILRILQYVKFI